MYKPEGDGNQTEYRYEYNSDGSVNYTNYSQPNSGSSTEPYHNSSDSWENSGGSDDSWDNANEDHFDEDKQKIFRELNNRNRDLARYESRSGNNEKLKQIVAGIRTKVQAVKDCANSASSSNEVYECWNLFDELNPLFDEANAAEEAVNLERELKDLERTEQRDFTEMERNGTNVSTLRSKLEQIRSVIKEMIAATDRDTRENLRWEKDDLWEAFHQEMESLRQASQFVQFTKQCDKDLAREVERVKKELTDTSITSQLDSLVTTCKNIVAQAKTEAEANGDFDGWELGEKMREQVWEKFKALTQSFHEERLCEDIKRGAEKLRKGITEEAPNMIANAPAEAQTELQNLVSKGKEILSNVNAALEADDCEKAADVMRKAEDLDHKFMDIVRQYGMEENLIDYSDDYEDLYNDFSDAGLSMSKDEFKKFMEDRKFGVREMDNMKKVSKDVLAEYVDNSANTDDQTLEFATDAGLDSTKLQSLMQAKADLLAEVEALRNQVHTLKQKIQEITSELGSYNFGIGAAKDEAKTLATQLSTMSEDEAEEAFREIKEKAITQKVEDGIIGFPDADDTEGNWFASFALKAKNKGLVNGNADGTLNPAGNLNYSEAVIAFGRIVGLNGGTSNSAVAQKLADWAEQGVAALESAGVDLSFMANVKAGDAIKREEVAVLISDVLGLENASISDTGFSDIGEASDREQQAIANVAAAGIMNGKGGTDEFGVGENLTRAALTKVLDLVSEYLGS